MRFALKRLGFYLIAAAVSVVLNFLLPRMMLETRSARCSRALEVSCLLRRWAR